MGAAAVQCWTSASVQCLYGLYSICATAPQRRLRGSCLLLPQGFRLALLFTLLALGIPGFPEVVVVDLVLDLVPLSLQHVLVLAADVLDDELAVDEEKELLQAPRSNRRSSFTKLALTPAASIHSVTRISSNPKDPLAASCGRVKHKLASSCEN